MSTLLQCLIGIQCNDFVMIAADQTTSLSVYIIKNDERKIFNVSDNIMVGLNGDSADMIQFSQYLMKNLALYKMRNHYELDTDAVAHFMRKSVSDGMKNGTPYILNSLVGGFDKEKGGRLYLMDYFGSCVKIGYAAHGIGGMICIGIMDSFYRPDLSEQEAFELIKTCIDEVHLRLFVKLPMFQVSVVNKNGISQLPSITPVTTFVTSSSGLV